LALLPCLASAKPLPRYGTFVFSSLCIERESGDIGGSRIVLVRTPGFDELNFDYGSGGLTGSTVDGLTIAGDHLTAQLTAEGERANLQATLSAEEAQVSFNFADGGALGSSPDRLRRVTDFSRKLATCR
jgi:hypothetical protein